VSVLASAEIVIRNARVYTVNRAWPWADSLAISAGQIVGVGAYDDIRHLVSPGTLMIDAKGKFLMPGFFDAHCHPSIYTFRACALDVFSCTSEQQYQSVVGGYAEENPDAAVIKGVGWFYSDFPEGGPRKEVIDEVVQDRPVLLYSGDVHSLWLNSKALEMANITRETPDPVGGSIGRSADGEPTGYINELPAVRLVEEKIRGFSPLEYAKGIKEFIRLGHRAGITSFHDAGVFDDNAYLAYKSLEDKSLIKNIVISLLIEPRVNLDLDTEFDRIKKLQGELKNYGYNVNGIKLFMDGVPEANTALLEEPYLTEPYEASPQWDIALFQEICQRADLDGLQIHIHCIGDRGVRLSLDALEKAFERSGRLDSRHILAHLQLVNPEDLVRMSKNSIVALPTPFWFEKEALYFEVEQHNLGLIRANREYPMKSLLSNRIPVAFGSDAPVGIGVPVTEIPFAPLLAIQMAVTRCNALKDAENIDNVLNPDERISLQEAIEGYTLGPAFANHVQNRQGSLESGKKADFIVLDGDPFSADIQQIYKIKVLGTFIDGKMVYQDETLHWCPGCE
jgi:hypothetical protein